MIQLIITLLILSNNWLQKPYNQLSYGNLQKTLRIVKLDSRRDWPENRIFSFNPNLGGGVILPPPVGLPLITQKR